MSNTLEVRTRPGTPMHEALVTTCDTADGKLSPYLTLGAGWPDGSFTVEKWTVEANGIVVWTLKESPPPEPKPFTATLMEPFPVGSVLQTTAGKWFRLTTTPVKLGPDRYAATAEYCDPPQNMHVDSEPPPAPDPVLAELVKIRELLEKLCSRGS